MKIIFFTCTFSTCNWAPKNIGPWAVAPLAYPQGHRLGPVLQQINPNHAFYDFIHIVPFTRASPKTKTTITNTIPITMILSKLTQQRAKHNQSKYF